MPKKFPTENPKAAAARQRKEAQKEAETLKKQQQEADVYWQDNDGDKHLTKKQQRKDDHLKKIKEQQQTKKIEAEKLEKETDSSANKVVNKVTRAQISRATTGSVSCSAASSASSKKTKASMMELEENVNRLMLADGGEEARSVDQAILLLNAGDNNDKGDRHPEKRMKAAHMAFEERRLKELKKENPGLRISQLTEIVWKEWQKAPQNPKNQCR